MSKEHVENFKAASYPDSMGGELPRFWGRRANPIPGAASYLDSMGGELSRFYGWRSVKWLKKFKVGMMSICPTGKDNLQISKTSVREVELPISESHSLGLVAIRLWTTTPPPFIGDQWHPSIQQLRSICWCHTPWPCLGFSKRSLRQMTTAGCWSQKKIPAKAETPPGQDQASEL